MTSSVEIVERELQVRRTVIAEMQVRKSVSIECTIHQIITQIFTVLRALIKEV